MANYCDYLIKIVGHRDDCDLFVKRLKSQYGPKHFWRMFEANIDKEETIGNETQVYISGTCAWSLESCCRESGYGGVDLFAINTSELNLKLEAYSREPGMGFEEHYIYNRGQCVVDDCLDIHILWWNKDEFPNYEDFKEKYPDAPPESEFDEYGDAITGGFGDDYGKWLI